MFYSSYEKRKCLSEGGIRKGGKSVENEGHVRYAEEVMNAIMAKFKRGRTGDGVGILTGSESETNGWLADRFTGDVILKITRLQK
jgi:hypothetical protein